MNVSPQMINNLYSMINVEPFIPYLKYFTFNMKEDGFYTEFQINQKKYFFEIFSVDNSLDEYICESKGVYEIISKSDKYTENSVYQMFKNFIIQGYNSIRADIENKLNFGNQNEFPDSVLVLSPDFIRLYNESKKAYDFGIINLSGMGLRVAFEHLLIDFLKRKYPESASKTKLKRANELVKMVNDSRLEELAKRNFWAGNDYAHYNKKHPSFSIEEYFEMINLTVELIQEYLKQEVLDMNVEAFKAKLPSI